MIIKKALKSLKMLIIGEKLLLQEKRLIMKELIAGDWKMDMIFTPFPLVLQRIFRFILRPLRILMMRAKKNKKKKSSNRKTIIKKKEKLL